MLSSFWNGHFFAKSLSIPEGQPPFAEQNSYDGATLAPEVPVAAVAAAVAAAEEKVEALVLPFNYSSAIHGQGGKVEGEER